MLNHFTSLASLYSECMKCDDPEIKFTQLVIEYTHQIKTSALQKYSEPIKTQLISSLFAYLKDNNLKVTTTDNYVIDLEYLKNRIEEEIEQCLRNS